MAANREEVLSLARTVLEQAGIRRSISSVKQLNSAYFMSLYNTIVDEEHQKLTPLGVNERSRLQMIIDSLKRLLPPQVSLSHINGRDIAKGDLLAIKNLLEIFSIIFELPSSSSEDSNVLTGEGGLKVVAQVLEEELNSSSVYIPTAFESLHSSLVTPPTHQSSSDESQSTLVTPPTNPLMSLDATPTVSPTSHQPLSLPLDQSTPHKGPKSRLDTLDGKVAPPPPLSISSLSTTPSSKTHPQDNLTNIEQESMNKEEREEEEEEEEETLTEEAREENDRYTEHEEKGGESEGGESEGEEREEGDDVSSSIDTRPRSKAILQTMYNNYVASGCTRKLSPWLQRNGNPHKIKDKKRSGTKYVSTQRRQSQQTSTGKLMATVQDAFPELQLSPASERRAWHLRMRQLNAQSTTRTLPDSNQRKNADIEKRHKLLLDTLKKELTHSQKMHNLSVKRQQEKALRLAVQTHRAVTARSRRYYNDYEVSIKKKLQRERTKEEQIFKKAFEDCLKIQRENKRELMRYAREKEELAHQKHRQHLESLQTFYENQLVLIAEAIEKEQRETAVREKEQQQASKQTERRLRTAMEEEIKELWSRLDDWETDNAHFRTCDKDLLKERLIKSLPRRLQ